MVKAKLTAAFVLAVLVIILALQNAQSVETRLLFFTVTMPRAALLAITMLVGVAVGILVALRLSGKRDPQFNN